MELPFRTLSRRLALALFGSFLVAICVAAQGADARPPARPDLKVSAIGNPPANVASGKSFTVKYAVKDAGPGTAKASTTRFYASRRRKHLTGDALLTSTKAKALKKNKTAAGTVKLRLSAAISPGFYYVVACADAGRKVKEKNERNNCTASKKPMIVTAALATSGGGGPGGNTPAGGSTPPAGDSPQPDPVVPALSIADVTTAEGNSSTTPLAFTVSLSQAGASTVTVHWATGDRTAVAPNDYLAASGDLSFAPGETSKTVTVQVVGDTAHELDESFDVGLSAPSGATIARGTASGTITDDDPLAALSSLSFHPVALSMGQESTGTVTLSGPAPAGGLSINLSASPSGQVSIPATVTVAEGQSTATFPATDESMSQPITVTAALGVQSVSAELYPVGSGHEVLTGLSFNPTSLSPGQQSTGTVTISEPAPAGDSTIDLTVNPSSGLTVPATVTVPAGQSTATFQVTDVSMSQVTSVTASLHASTSSANLFPSGIATHLVINEVDYDQIGTDSNEFVEVYNPTSSSVSLSSLALVLVNGSNNAEYTRVGLSSAGASLPAGGYLVIADNGVSLPGGVPVIRLGPSNEIQDGAPDGVALIDTSSNTLVDALSYEGSITAAQISGFPTTVSLVEGTALPIGTADSNSINVSLGREPNGIDSEDASSDWVVDSTPTPGAANSH